MNYRKEGIKLWYDHIFNPNGSKFYLQTIEYIIVFSLNFQWMEF